MRKKQVEEKESVGQPGRVKEFIKRNYRRFLVGVIVLAILSALALSPGIGFTATVKITSSQLAVPGHPCHGYLCNGSVKATFNPYLYPVNHLFGSEISTEFSGLSDPYDRLGKSVQERIVIAILLSEFPINIPLFYVVGFFLTVGIEKAVKKVEGKVR